MPSLDRPKMTTEVPALPPRAADMHKGQAGKVAIIAGSPGMSGAAILCGLGALRGGAGLVRVYCPESIQPIVATSEPCFMTIPLPELKDGTIGDAAAREGIATLDWADVVAVGPGLGASDGPLKFMMRLAFVARPWRIRCGCAKSHRPVSTRRQSLAKPRRRANDHYPPPRRNGPPAQRRRPTGVERQRRRDPRANRS